MMDKSRRRRRSDTNVTEFENFFQGWLIRQENYLQELRSTLQNSHESTDEHRLDLIAGVLAHYQQYYEQKSRIANHHISIVFSPPWFSPFERTFFWIAGFKPGLAFRIARDSVEDLSEDQIGRMERVKAETRAEERELENELARVQESVAATPVVAVGMRGETLPVNGEYAEVESAVERLKAEMEVVVGNADILRTRTAERVAEVLTPVQNLRFLMAVAELQLGIRRWGAEIEDDGGR